MSKQRLENISPYFLAKVLEITNEEVFTLARELYEMQILDYKFNCKCPQCGEDVVVYGIGEKAKNDECECGCSREKLVENSTVLYNIDKEAMTSINRKQELNPLTAIIGGVSRKKDNITNLRKETKVVQITKEADKMKIFLGSSKESKAKMNEAAVAIAELGYEPICWNSTGVFIPGRTTCENLISIAEDVDAAMFIFSNDDLTWFRDELTSRVRDNVMFEYGLFAGKLGERNVVFGVHNKTNIASDLHGITFVNLDQSQVLFKKEIQVWLESIK